MLKDNFSIEFRKVKYNIPEKVYKQYVKYVEPLNENWGERYIEAYSLMGESKEITEKKILKHMLIELKIYKSIYGIPIDLNDL